MTNMPDEALIQRARRQLRGYDTLRQDSFFQRENGKYYTLINYPSLKGMHDHSDEQFAFVRTTPHHKRLYVHVPFCSGHCTFCNYRILLGEQDHWPYLNYLIKELDLLCDAYGEPLQIDNILFGGGTPSLLSLKELEFLFENIFSRIDLRSHYMCFELHPEMLHSPDCDAKLQLIRDAGINRVNVGVQVYDDQVLKAVNRRATAADNVELIRRVDQLGFQYVNHDLILGLPHQSLESWEDTIEQTLRHRPTSISPFFCWMKPSVPIFTHYQKRTSDFPTLDETLTMTLMYMEAFEQRGYQFGTIDFYYQPQPTQTEAGFEDDGAHEFTSFMHTDFDVLALGISGYGFINNTRYMNHLDVPKYYECIDQGVMPIYRYDELPSDDMLRLNLMYSLRYASVQTEEFNARYGVCVADDFREEFDKLAQLQLIKWNGNEIQATELGKIFSDEMCMVFVSQRVKDNVRRDEARVERDSELLERYSYLYNIG